MNYTPRLDAASWVSVQRFVRSCVAKCADRTAYCEADLMQAATRLAAWVVSQPTLKLTRAVAFQPLTIENFTADITAGYSPASRGNRRSMLLRMSEVLLGDAARRTRTAALPASAARAPYTPTEIAQVRLWLKSCGGSQRANAAVLVALGLGAGLSAGEVLGVLASDVSTTAGRTFVTVQGGRPRTVEVHSEWAVGLRIALLDVSPSAWAFCNGRNTGGKNLVTNFVAKTSGVGLAPQSQRMRSTWIVGHLNAGTGTIALMEGAGVSSLEAITRYVKFAANKS